MNESAVYSSCFAVCGCLIFVVCVWALTGCEAHVQVESKATPPKQEQKWVEVVSTEYINNWQAIYVINDNRSGKTHVVFDHMDSGVILLNTYDTPKADSDSSRASTGLNQER